MAGPVLGLGEAARACGVSTSTVRRRKDALVQAGATVSDRRWSIPVAALIQVGLMPRVSPPDAEPGPPVQADELDELRERARAAEADAALLRERLSGAQDLLAERARTMAALEGQVSALQRALTAGPGEGSQGGSTPVVSGGATGGSTAESDTLSGGSTPEPRTDSKPAGLRAFLRRIRR